MEVAHATPIPQDQLQVNSSQRSPSHSLPSPTLRALHKGFTQVNSPHPLRVMPQMSKLRHRQVTCPWSQ